MNDDITNEVSGFIYNVSPIKRGPKKQYFDFNVQTGKGSSIRSVCFAPAKRKIFLDAEQTSTPRKIRKFVCDRDNSSDILISDNVAVEQLKSSDASFVKTDVSSSGAMNLSSLQMVCPNQLVTLKAKVINLQPATDIRIRDNELKKAEAQLVDAHAFIKIVIWQDDIKKIKEGGTYQFKNLRVKINKFSNELYVNPAKDISQITECESFDEALAVPEHVPDEFVSCTIQGEILGVSDVRADLCCVRCSRTIRDQQAKTVVVCGDPNCKLKQKVARCGKKWFAKVFVSSERKKGTLVLHHDMILKTIQLQKQTDLDCASMTKEQVEDCFLALPDLKFTYRKSMVVTDVVVVEDGMDDNDDDDALLSLGF